MSGHIIRTCPVKRQIIPNRSPMELLDCTMIIRTLCNVKAIEQQTLATKQGLLLENMTLLTSIIQHLFDFQSILT